MLTATLTHPYDAIAASYDSLFVTAEDRAEDARVIAALGYRGGTILDIGCGTGLLLDHLTPTRYLGVDPSRIMLDRLRAKHGRRLVFEMPFERFIAPCPIDFAVALYGSASYVSAEALQRLPSMLRPGGRYFIMLYQPGYEPVTYRRTGIRVPHFNHPRDVLPGVVHDMGNYLAIEGATP